MKRESNAVFDITSLKLMRNRAGLREFLATMQNVARPPIAHIFDFNTVLGIPHDDIPPASVDIVVTSPPYGDSHTTVAYGQYSRLSAAWLDLSEPDKIDRKLMGGKVLKKIPDFPSDPLNEALGEVSKHDKKRALEVASFYSELRDSIAHVSHVIRPGGCACYVIGNRKVKGIVLPTDTVIRDFFECCAFDHVDTFRRSIPNKRMPLRNSPSNVVGASDNTMVQEYIVVMRSKAPRAFREERLDIGISKMEGEHENVGGVAEKRVSWTVRKKTNRRKDKRLSGFPGRNSKTRNRRQKRG